MTYLLDANVWIDALRGSDPNVIRRMNNVAQAVANDLVLVTANDGEFSRVPSLNLENWRL